jgi:hypothetical protein
MPAQIHEAIKDILEKEQSQTTAIKKALNSFGFVTSIADDMVREIIHLPPGQVDDPLPKKLRDRVAALLARRNSCKEFERNVLDWMLIELVQVLLHARGTGMKDPIDTPRLVIALTCWDELSTDSTPEEILQQKMPLFAHFIAANWLAGAFKIIGVSAQEFPLKTDEARDKYLDEMPQNFGYLVLDDNPKEKDLTRLIEKALSL